MTPLPDPAAAAAPIVARARRVAVLVQRLAFVALVALAAERLVAGSTPWRAPSGSNGRSAI